MLDYLYAYLLPTPLRVLAAALATGLVGGVIGWRHTSARVAGAWTHVTADATEGRQHAYRDPLRTERIQRTPAAVTAAAIAGYALCFGHASWLVIALDEARLGRAGRALLGVGLFGIGAALTHTTHVLVMRGPAVPSSLRRRAMVAGALALAAHGALVVFLAAVSMEVFDERSIEVRGVKGFSEGMSLGQIREMLRSQPNLLSAGGHLLMTWHALATWALSHAVGSLVQATLLLVVTRATHDPSATTPQLPWFRRRWWLVPSGGAVLLFLGGGLFVIFGVPILSTRFVYAQVRPVCSLPEMPSGTTDLQSRHDVDLMSEKAFVQFRASDPGAYAAQLASAGYTEVKPAERGDFLSGSEFGSAAPPKSVQHYRLHKEYSRQPGVIDAATLCDVHVDGASGRIRVWMWAGD